MLVMEELPKQVNGLRHRLRAGLGAELPSDLDRVHHPVAVATRGDLYNFHQFDLRTYQETAAASVESAVRGVPKRAAQGSRWLRKREPKRLRDNPCCFTSGQGL